MQKASMIVLLVFCAASVALLSASGECSPTSECGGDAEGVSLLQSHATRIQRAVAPNPKSGSSRTRAAACPGDADAAGIAVEFWKDFFEDECDVEWSDVDKGLKARLLMGMTVPTHKSDGNVDPLKCEVLVTTPGQNGAESGGDLSFTISPPAVAQPVDENWNAAPDSATYYSHLNFSDPCALRPRGGMQRISMRTSFVWLKPFLLRIAVVLSDSTNTQRSRSRTFSMGIGQFARPPLQGVMTAKFSSNDYSGITSKYESNNIQVFWNSRHSFYSWTAPFVEPQDCYTAETGWARWLRPFEYSVTSEGGWYSRSYVGTRVDVVNHTSCCCQYIRSDNKDFRLTEYCDIVPGQAGSLFEACTPFMVNLCPGTNASAWNQKSRWNTKPYHEAYSAEIQSLDVSRMPYLSKFENGPRLKVTKIDPPFDELRADHSSHA